MLWSNRVSNHRQNLLETFQRKYKYKSHLLWRSHFLHNLARLYFEVLDTGYSKCANFKNWVTIRNVLYHGEFG